MKSISNKTGYIVPVGQINGGLLNNLTDILSKKFKLSFETAAPVDIPPLAYNSGRDQYSTDEIFSILKKFEAEKVLGVIDKDLYTEGLNFIFGRAESPGQCALISITRLKQKSHNGFDDNRIFFERVTKEAVHELGHTYGLGHCADENCVMFFSNSLPDTDKKGVSFCKSCRAKIGL